MTSRPPASSDLPDPVEASLDEALAATFPASDPINLHQWSEMEHEDKAQAAVTPIVPVILEPPPLDRSELYLRGPTAFCA
jgi:hypothetical protein